MKRIIFVMLVCFCASLIAGVTLAEKTPGDDTQTITKQLADNIQFVYKKSPAGRCYEIIVSYSRSYNKLKPLMNSHEIPCDSSSATTTTTEEFSFKM